MDDQPRVLLLDDDEAFCEEFREYLDSNGFDVSAHISLDAALVQIRALPFDLLILDQRLGKRDLLSTLDEFRRIFSGGVVFLSANQEEADRIIALERGADDFILKTQSPREILARLRAAVRKWRRGSVVNGADGAAAMVTAERDAEPAPGAWLLDVGARELLRPDGSVVPLTGAEFEVVRVLASHRGEVVPRQMFYPRVMHRVYQPKDRTLDNLISRVRSKLQVHLPGVEVIKSVRGAGYVLASLTIEVCSSRAAKNGHNPTPPPTP